MSNLPSRGRCHAAFLLGYSARLRDCDTIADWIQATLNKPTLMAAALDLEGTAMLLISAGLAFIEEKVSITPQLASYSRIADRDSLIGIARLFLAVRPPEWLRDAIVLGRFIREYVPSDDLATLSWLGNELEPILISAYQEVYGPRDGDLKKLLGDGGEQAIMAALRACGQNPRHVALASDRYGYDIELGYGSNLHGIEVKASVGSSAYRIFVSRNEFDVAMRMLSGWSLVQIIFSTEILVSGCITAADVRCIRRLNAETLFSMAPAESKGFRWLESAEFSPASESWTYSDLVVPDSFQAPLG